MPRSCLSSAAVASVAPIQIVRSVISACSGCSKTLKANLCAPRVSKVRSGRFRSLGLDGCLHGRTSCAGDDAYLRAAGPDSNWPLHLLQERLHGGRAPPPVRRSQKPGERRGASAAPELLGSRTARRSLRAPSARLCHVSGLGLQLINTPLLFQLGRFRFQTAHLPLTAGRAANFRRTNYAGRPRTLQSSTMLCLRL